MSVIDFELVGRLLLACLCGIIIGLERNTRAKEAGIRTHCIVACASALMMIVSKYGFFDMIEDMLQFSADVRLDPSRMAQGIVTGVGFLGAGIIYFQRGVIKGLTTAAGVWAVSGIGMAIGAGMYVIGVAATLIILIMQYLLHRRLPFVKVYKTKIVKVYEVPEKGFQEFTNDIFKNLDITVVDVSIVKNQDGTMDYSFCVEVPRTISEEYIMGLFDYRIKVDFSH